jgi:hypothetical protein
MPYIKQEQREILEPYLASLEPVDEGQLNYVISTICQSYLKTKGVNYANINAVVGVLECAKLEIYRRIASHYEDNKINTNGDAMILNEYRRNNEQ